MRWLTFILCAAVAISLMMGGGKKTTAEHSSGDATTETQAGGNIQTNPQVAE